MMASTKMIPCSCALVAMDARRIYDEINSLFNDVYYENMIYPDIEHRIDRRVDDLRSGIDDFLSIGCADDVEGREDLEAVMSNIDDIQKEFHSGYGSVNHTVAELNLMADRANTSMRKSLSSGCKVV